MFLGMHGDYITSVAETRAELEKLQEVAGFSDIVETHEKVEYINGEYVLGTAKINEIQRQMREKAYIAETDPIQTHIDRLKDKEQTPEIIAEIQALRIERDEKIDAIKARYPYYD